MLRSDVVFRKTTAREGRWAWLGWALTPPGWLYGAAASLRRRRMEGRGLRIGVPVLSVGNIEVGGTGKTPVTIWLARRISAMGYDVVVVARNTGDRKDPCRVRADSVATPGGIGDEALLLAEKLVGKARVYTGRSKTEAALKALSEKKPDLVIVDDGFQHLRLHRDLDLVVLDFEEPFGRGGVLPAGTLREPPSSLAAADHIWINRVKPGMSAEWVRRRLADHNWKAPVQFSRMRPGIVRLACSRSRGDIPAGPVIAFCGLGRPESFRQTLEEAGFTVARLVTFPDHHPYTGSDMEDLGRMMRSARAEALVTTAKDAVKLQGLPGTDAILVLEASLEVEGAVADLLADVERVIGNYRSTGRTEETV
jgi:tetraacyldisaccharide 4'-kinase